ncbi:MAG: HpcH/HpaI aldolase/citrate lyase family protein [Puniceicoccaceae bacterium]
MRVEKSSLHERLKREALVGPFSKTSDPNLIEAMGYGGFDFVILDLEHGPNDIVNLGNLIRAAERTGLSAVVRVLTTNQIGRALDLGAAAIQIPHISTAEDAQRAVESARFGPMGKRGVCRYVRAAEHSSMEKGLYFSSANEISVIAQVEGRAGLENLVQILEVPGVDVIFLGVYDLSQSLGFTGEVERREVVDALSEVVRLCAAKGIPVGTFVESVETAHCYRQLGVQYLCYSVDVGLLFEASRAISTAVKRAK